MAMNNLVNGGNIGRSLSSGGLNMPGVASRLNLTGNSRSQYLESPVLLSSLQYVCVTYSTNSNSCVV